MFIYGITLFTLSSLACGLSGAQGVLVAARAIQGVGGAIASAVSLSLIMTLFTETDERAKAMGFFGFVASGGGTLGVLLGGVLDRFAELALDLPRQRPDRDRRLRAVPAAAAGRTRAPRRGGRLDVPGALSVTAALMVAVYAIVNGNENGWTSFETLGLLALAAALLAAVPDDRVARQRPADAAAAVPARATCATANVVGVLWAAAMFAWFFLAALYLQLVLGYSPLEVGLAFRRRR